MRSINTEVLIVGAGLSGLLCAMKYAELERPSHLLVVDEGDSKCKIRPILLSLSVKSALREVKSLRPYIPKFAKYLVGTITLSPFDHQIISDDTYIVNYSDILYAFQDVCRSLNIQVRYHSKVTSINALQNYVETSTNDRINYGSLILARGPVSKDDRGLITCYPQYVDTDVGKYEVRLPRIMETNVSPANSRSIILPTPSSLPSVEGKTIAIGTSGGYVDFLTYENYLYKVESALVAAKALARKNPLSFYTDMDKTYNEIKVSLQLRGMLVNLPAKQFTSEMATILRDTLLYSTDTYAHLAQLLTRKGD